MFLHRVIELFSTLLVEPPHVTNRNGHHFAIGRIIHITNHSYPTNRMFHMIKYDPSILQIPCKLHSCDKTCSAPHTIYGHLENEHLLSKNLSKEATPLDVVISTLGFQFKDVINVTTIRMMFERNNKLTNVGRVQFLELCPRFAPITHL
jgi:hypothetical protein